jgi:uncharacterized integral membrane protein
MKAKTIVLLVAAGLLTILVIQNSKTVPIRLFFWPISMPVIILVPAIFLLGFFAGFWRAHFGPRRNRRQAAEPPLPAQLSGRP